MLPHIDGYLERIRQSQEASIRPLREQGMSIRKIAATLGIPKSTVFDRLNGAK